MRCFLLICSFVLLPLVGCGDPFDPASLITSTRVIGAQVEVDGDLARATPAPGETAHVRFRVVSPDGAHELRWAFVTCAGRGGASGCERAPIATSTGHGVEPVLDVAVPPRAALGDVDTLAVLGIVCTHGEPALSEAGLPTCAGDDGDGTPVQLSVHLATRAGDANHNPVLDGTALSIDGRPWNELLLESACDEKSGVPELRADATKHVLTLRLPEQARERDEALQLSTFVTRGELAEQFTFVEPSQSLRDELTLEWTAPSADELSSATDTMRFVVAVRDGRGGFASLERAVCVRR